MSWYNALTRVGLTLVMTSALCATTFAQKSAAPGVRH